METNSEPESQLEQSLQRNIGSDWSKIIDPLHVPKTTTLSPHELEEWYAEKERERAIQIEEGLFPIPRPVGGGFMPFAHRIATTTLGQDLVSVQPMPMPMGKLYHIDIQCEIKPKKRRNRKK
jgi:hypothetical protein